MAISVITSSATSAPTLTGQTGSLVALLDAVLVDGFGSTPPLGGGWSSYISPNGQRGLFRPPAGNRRWFYVNDDGAQSGGARLAVASMYAEATGFDEANNPTGVVGSAGINSCWMKSCTLDATARSWRVYGDDQGVWLATVWGLTRAGLGTPWLLNYFGDCASYLPNDANNTLLIGGNTSDPQSHYDDVITAFQTLAAYNATAQAGHVVFRNYLGTAGVGFVKVADNAVSTTMGTAGYQYPNPVDGNLLMSPIQFCENSVLRGILPGVYQVLHACPFAGVTGIAGCADLAGRTLHALPIPGTSTSMGNILIDCTGPWR